MPAMPTPPNPPTNTFAFLFTDIEGSSTLWEQHPSAMQPAVDRHDAILRSSIEANSGTVFKIVGYAFCAAFPTAPQALSTALDAQRALSQEPWPPEIAPLRVRMALHIGAAEIREGDYVGPSLNRIARLLSTAHGGQTLLTLPTEELLRDNLPPGVTLLNMGEYRLRDLIRPEHIYQLLAPDLPSEFPPLKTLDNRPNNLPSQPTPLVGREKELAELAPLLTREDVRLVPLTGPGGPAKPRLVLQLAADLLDSFPDGVWFVELAALVEARLVVPTIAQTLGVKETGGGTPIIDTLKEYLGDKKLLLVVDNFEQVAAAANDVSQLLTSTRGVKVLVTSRMPLKVTGEQEYSTPPLSVPDLTRIEGRLGAGGWGHERRRGAAGAGPA